MRQQSRKEIQYYMNQEVQTNLYHPYVEKYIDFGGLMAH